MYRVETIDGWIKIKPYLLDKTQVLANVCCNDRDETVESLYMNIEDYLLNDNDNIFIGVCIKDQKIASYVVFMKHDSLCCIAHLWCSPGYLFTLLDYIPVLRNFADDLPIYFDSKREVSNKLLKRFKTKIRYIRYELEDNPNEQQST